ncbi:hypothetical protein GW17_00020052 [Ensete ventricosum]|nr:hypothetical protein GW17_00020052 [Ensete ventricosum]
MVDINHAHNIIKYMCRFNKNLRTIWGRTTLRRRTTTTLKISGMDDLRQAGIKATSEAVGKDIFFSNPLCIHNRLKTTLSRTLTRSSEGPHRASRLDEAFCAGTFGRPEINPGATATNPNHSQECTLPTLPELHPPLLLEVDADKHVHTEGTIVSTESTGMIRRNATTSTIRSKISFGRDIFNGDSSSTRKAYARSTVEKRPKRDSDPEITFNSGNKEYPNHDNALVISVRIVNARVKRIMIDARSSADIDTSMLFRNWN